MIHRNIVVGVCILGLLAGAITIAQTQRDAGPVVIDLKVTSPELPALPEASDGWLSRLRSWLTIRQPIRLQPAIGTILKVEATAYASSPYQTDDTPCITAAGTTVRSGVVATNFLPLGTLLEIDGRRYSVEDWMNRRHHGYYLDVWFPSTSDALTFGRRKLEIKIIGYGTPGQTLTPPVPQKVSLLRRAGGWLRTAVNPNVNRFDVDCFP